MMVLIFGLCAFITVIGVSLILFAIAYTLCFRSKLSFPTLLIGLSGIPICFVAGMLYDLIYGKKGPEYMINIGVSIAVVLIVFLFFACYYMNKYNTDEENSVGESKEKKKETDQDFSECKKLNELAGQISDESVKEKILSVSEYISQGYTKIKANGNDDGFYKNAFGYVSTFAEITEEYINIKKSEIHTEKMGEAEKIYLHLIDEMVRTSKEIRDRAYDESVAEMIEKANNLLACIKSDMQSNGECL